MKRIKTPEAPVAVGAYSQGVISGDLLFTAGQIGLTPAGELVSGIEAQTRQTMANLQAILGAAGCQLAEHVLKTQIYVINEEDTSTVNGIYSEYFEVNKKPAREFLVVKAIPFKTPTEQALIEMSMIAEVPKQ